MQKWHNYKLPTGPERQASHVHGANNMIAVLLFTCRRTGKSVDIGGLEYFYAGHNNERVPCESLQDFSLEPWREQPTYAPRHRYHSQSNRFHSTQYIFRPFQYNLSTNRGRPSSQSATNVRPRNDVIRNVIATNLAELETFMRAITSAIKTLDRSMYTKSKEVCEVSLL